MTAPEHVQEKKNLKEELSLANRTNDTNIQFNYYQVRGIYLYAKCKSKKCQAELRYKKERDGFRLYHSQTLHEHEERRKTQEKLFQCWIQELPFGIHPQAVKQLTVDKFKISEARFYYLFRKINHSVSFKQLIDHLNEKNCEIRSDPFENDPIQLPELMIIVTPLMKQNFDQFGHWVGFDFTFNLIQETHKNGRNWKLGCFMGISSSKKIVPFGLVVSTDETKERFCQIFQTFFEIMKKQPKIIISDESPAMISAINELKNRNQYEGLHLLDSYHVLKNIRKNLKNKDHWHFFRDLLSQQTAEEFEFVLNQGLEAIQHEDDILLLKKFVQKSNFHCFSQIPPAFFGFLPNTSMNEKVHDLIKSVLPYSKPFSTVITKLVGFLDRLGGRCDQYKLHIVRMETFFGFPALKEVRFLVCESIFLRIICQISKSLHYETTILESQFCEVRKGNIGYKIQMTNQNLWKCQCNYSEKTGIPCSHLMRVLFLKKSRLAPYIHKHWIIQKTLQERKNHQRKTRRNRIK